MGVVILICAMALWGLVHSLSASLAVKGFFQRVFGVGFMRIYRLGYNLFALVSFLPILWLAATLPEETLYVIQEPWSYLMMAGQGLAALLLFITLLQTDTLSFIGLRQVVAPEENPGALVTSGFYRFVRHPLYTFGLLFLWLTPVLTVNSLAVYIAATVYIIIGAYFEERKLLRQFGAAYADYRSITPMLIPGLFFRRNK